MIFQLKNAVSYHIDFLRHKLSVQGLVTLQKLNNQGTVLFILHLQLINIKKDGICYIYYYS